MLQDFVLKDRTPLQLATAWKDQLPFAQKSTKQRFMDNNIIGKSYEEIVNVLVQKINDELVKGGFSSITKEAILLGMGAGDLTAESPVALGVVSSGVDIDLLVTDSNLNEANESRVFFFVGSMLILIVGVLTFLFFKPKKRR